MALQIYTLALGNLKDDQAGNNYSADTPVYIVKSDGLFADIYRDSSGSSLISQNGIDNISNESGEFKFYVESGQYIARVNGKENLINVIGSTYFDSRVEDSVSQIIEETQKSRGFRVVGTFADGFTYELFNDVGIDADGNSWIYVGAGAPNKVVAAGTVPSVGDGYQQVTFNAASNIKFNDNSSVQEFRDSSRVESKLLEIGSLSPNIGSKFKVMDLSGASYDVVGSSDSGGWYVDFGSATLKLKLIVDSHEMQLSKLMTNEDAQQAILYLSSVGVGVIVDKDITSSTITTDKLKITLADNCDISAANPNQDSLFLNIPHLTIRTGDGSSFGKVTTFKNKVYNVELGNNIDVLDVRGGFSSNLNGDTESFFRCDPGVTPSSPVVGCFINFEGGFEITGFTRSGIELPVSAMEDNSSATAKGLKVHSGSGRCIQFGDNENRFKNVEVSNNIRLGDVVSSGNSEAKAILCYCENYSINHNRNIKNISNSGTSGAEGVYVKGSYGEITYNKLLDAGSSSDGCITLKGSGWYSDEDYADEGNWSTIAYNTIRMRNESFNSKGIGLFNSYVNVIGNKLIDIRPNSDSLSYSQAISIGGSNAVSSVIISENTTLGWRSVFGNTTPSTKGRALIGDNIKIHGNNCVGWSDAVIAWDSRCRIINRPMTFASVGNIIEIVGGLSQNGEFNPSTYPIGSKIVVSGTTSNNGEFTVVYVGRFALEVAEELVDESVTPEISRLETNNLSILGNTFEGVGAGIALRSQGGRVKSINLDNNEYINCGYAYRFDIDNAIGTLKVGAGEVYNNVLDVDFGTPKADSTEYGVAVVSVGNVGDQVGMKTYKDSFSVLRGG